MNNRGAPPSALCLTEGLAHLEKAEERSAALGVKAEKRLLRDLEFTDRAHLLRAVRQLQELTALGEL